MHQSKIKEKNLKKQLEGGNYVILKGTIIQLRDDSLTETMKAKRE